MKRLIVLVLTVLITWSCSDEIKFNTPAVQGRKDGVLWRATSYDVSFNSGGRIVITGSNNIETISFTVPNIEVDSYWLGRGSSSKAEFVDSDGIRFSTNSVPDPSLSLYPADGELIINQITETTLSGKFRFNAYSNDGLETVNFSQGVLFDVPYSGIANDIVSCDQAIADREATEEIFNNTDITSPNYPEVCQNYKDALTQQITSCGGGGANSPIQIIIDSLGDCQ